MWSGPGAGAEQVHHTRTEGERGTQGKKGGLRPGGAPSWCRGVVVNKLWRLLRVVAQVTQAVAATAAAAAPCCSCSSLPLLAAHHQRPLRRCCV